MPTLRELAADQAFDLQSAEGEAQEIDTQDPDAEEEYADEPEADDPSDEEETDGEETPEADDDGTPDEEQAGDAEGDGEDEDYIGGVKPDESDPFHKSLQADYTRKTQALAEQRKALGALAELNDLLGGVGLTADTLIEAFRNPEAFAQQQAQAEPEEPDYGNDPILARIQEQLDNDEYASETERFLLEVSRDERIEKLQQEQAQARYDAWQQDQARTHSLTEQLSRLERDPRLKQTVSRPQEKAVIFDYAQNPQKLSVEMIAKAVDYDQMVARNAVALKQARQQGYDEGRKGRRSAQEAATETGLSAQSVEENREIAYSPKGGLLEMFNEAERRGMVKIAAPRRR